MASWKKILTDGDNTNLATANLTADASRTFTLAVSSALTFTSANGSDLLKLTSSPVGAATDAVTIEAAEVALKHPVGSGVLQLKFYESSNDAGDHYVSLHAPTTMSADVSLTLPAADGTSGQFLKTNGSGVLSFADGGSGGTVIDDWAENRVLTGGDSNTNIDAEQYLTFQPYTVSQQNNNSTYRLQNFGVINSKSNGTKPTGTVWDTDNAYGDALLNASSTSSSAYSNTGTNISMRITSSALTKGQIHRYASDGTLVAAQANSSTTATGMLGLYVNETLTSQVSVTLLLQGAVLVPNTEIIGTFATGAILYLSDTNAGHFTYNIPTTTGDIVRHMGYALRSITSGSVPCTLVHFNPSFDFLEIA